MWTVGAAYDRYMGRWSRLVAREFAPWLGCGDELRWLDVGSGTGVLAGVVADRCRPRLVLGVDRSEAFARAAADGAAAGCTADDRSAADRGSADRGSAGSACRFVVADATALPVRDGSFDVAVSALTLNFLPGPAAVVAAMVGSVRPGGTVAAYVWDYADGMGFLRRFWDAAGRAVPSAAALDEGRRFPLCRPEALRGLWAAAGLVDVATTAIEVPTVFADFDDLWAPFLAGQGPAPAFVASLAPVERDRVRDELGAAVPRRSDGSIGFTARAWAVRGRRPARTPPGTALSVARGRPG